MHTIKFNGGIGNQLFQYTFYKYCKENGIEVSADTSIYKKMNIHGGFLIDKMIPQNTLSETTDDVERYYDAFNLSQRIYNKLFHHVGNHYYEAFFKDYHDIVPFLKKTESCYLEGWWQYKDVAIPLVSKIREETWRLSQSTDESGKEVLDRIHEYESVAVHVRRGDYLNASALYGNICTAAYYKSAIDYVKRKIEKPVFFIFSDDIEYCKSVFDEDAFVVPPADQEKAYIDILLMAECKHHIVANSSFSWWGTALSENNGLIIMPNRHNNLQDENPLAFDGAILIEKNGSVVSR